MEQVHAPGDEWDDDDQIVVSSESQVSKKLSEMTTRRVILLVLSILLILPFFQADMYKDALPTSAQYGMDDLYRRFREDMLKFEPFTGQAQRVKYLSSLDRQNYVDDFLLYTYYHNWFCEEIPSDAANSPMTSFGKLFWVGGSPVDSPEGEFFLPGSSSTAQTDWNQQWNGDSWPLYLCNIPLPAQAALRMPWSNATNCLEGSIRGVSIIESEDSRVKCPRDLRFQERIVTTPGMGTTNENQFVFMFVFDRRSGSKFEAGLNSLQTIFICLLLGLGAMTFSKDANQVVLAPIERMIMKLETIRANPIAAMSLGEEDDRHAESLTDQFSKTRDSIALTMENSQEIRQLKRPSAIGRMCNAGRNWAKVLCFTKKSKDAPEPMETVVLEKTIIKIGSLLALGFGEAGAEIIGENMKCNESSRLNAMVPGKRVDAVMAYCDIRNFTEATEVLEDQVMVFVNRIAGVVHTVVHEFFGSPNQNVGDAFLLVWRLTGRTESEKQRLADMAAISFVKVMAGVSKSALLAEYRSHPKLIKRVPNYRVCLAFGLHTGWAIEGAIGSSFKIDASYLSPEVTMASRLQTFSKIYGTASIVSEPLVKLLSKPVADLCRLIDCVKLPTGQGQDLTEAFELHTIDIEEMAVDVVAVHRIKERDRIKQKHERQKNRNQRWEKSFSIEEYLSNDSDIKIMRRKFTPNFFDTFAKGQQAYKSGDWETAIAALEETRFINVLEDGPSTNLIRYMRSKHCEAPENWPGYRVFLSV